MSGSVGSEKAGEQKFERSALAIARIVLRIALSILFFFASFMKGVQLLTEPSLGEGVFNSRLFVTVLTLGEFALALWLLFGFLPRLTCYFLIFLFSAFTLYSLYRALVLKADSCNCYGALKMPPLISLFLSFAPFISVFENEEPAVSRMNQIKQSYNEGFVGNDLRG